MEHSQSNTNGLLEVKKAKVVAVYAIRAYREVEI
jgi:hypothetical protein